MKQMKKEKEKNEITEKGNRENNRQILTTCIKENWEENNARNSRYEKKKNG